MIRVEEDGDLWTLKIDRPKKANALTKSMLNDLADALGDARKARAVILTAIGPVFSAGMDLDEAQTGLATDPVWERVSAAMAELPCLTIAALNGTLVGGAFGMVLAADLRVVAPEASFFYPVMKLGFLPQPSDPRRLTALVGPARAKLLLMAGSKFTAEDALAYGLVDVIDADPFARAQELASATLGARPEHAAAVKRLLG